MSSEQNNINEEVLRRLQMNIYFTIKDNYKTKQKTKKELTKIIMKKIEGAVENDN